jgi:hypothetical protein
MEPGHETEAAGADDQAIFIVHPSAVVRRLIAMAGCADRLPLVSADSGMTPAGGAGGTLTRRPGDQDAGAA